MGVPHTSILEGRDGIQNGRQAGTCCGDLPASPFMSEFPTFVQLFARHDSGDSNHVRIPQRALDALLLNFSKTWQRRVPSCQSSQSTAETSHHQKKNKKTKNKQKNKK